MRLLRLGAWMISVCTAILWTFLLVVSSAAAPVDSHGGYDSSNYNYGGASAGHALDNFTPTAIAVAASGSPGGGVIAVSNEATGCIYDLPVELVAPNTIVDAGKYDYLFGNVSSNSHNLNRSLQNQRQLNRVGVYDNAAGRDMLSSHFDDVLSTDSNIVRTWTDEWGTHQIRESVFAGPNGILRFESSWQVTSDGFRLETVIPFGGG